MEGLSQALLAERKRAFVKRRSGSVAAAFAAAQPCGLHSARLPAASCQLSVNRLSEVWTSSGHSWGC